MGAGSLGVKAKPNTLVCDIAADGCKKSPSHPLIATCDKGGHKRAEQRRQAVEEEMMAHTRTDATGDITTQNMSYTVTGEKKADAPSTGRGHVGTTQ
eukprot:3303638-Alexandrium_andersonii.AAC.1